MKKGVSLLALVATIIVLGIIASTIVVASADAISNTKKMQFASEIRTIQSKMREAKLMGNLDKALGAEIKIDDVINPEFMPELQYERLDEVTNQATLYQINLSGLAVQEVSRGNQKEGAKDTYLYSKTTGKVYYYLGYKVKNDTFYTIVPEIDVKNTFTDLDYFPMLQDSAVQELSVDCKAYASQAGYLKDESAKYYTVFSTTKNVLELTASFDASYYLGQIDCKTKTLYVYDCTGTTAKNGGDIVIQLNTVGGMQTISDYKSVPFDNTPPTLTKSKVNIIYYDTANGVKVRIYLEDGAIVDPLSASSVASGVKQIRYYFGAFPGTIENLRKVSTQVKDNTIDLDTKSTVAKIYFYMEDKAGNASYEYVDVPTAIMNKIIESDE